MIELSRVSILFILIIFNYILLTIGLWAWLPDLFIIQTLLFTTFSKKIPSVYFFIIKGFIIDLFFSEYSVPYTLSFSLIGLYLNFGKLKWIQRSLLEQLLLIVLASILLNILLNFTNDYYLNIQARIVINPLMNALIWAGIFMTQRHKWLKKF